ncbi:MAG: hypothetical protein ACREQ5_33650, partial [Candidatus Dormibacteria bacterium]
MRFANLRRGDALVPAVLMDDTIYELRLGLDGITNDLDLIGSGPALLFDLAIASGIPEMAGTLEHAIARGALPEHAMSELGPPVTRPSKIICVGRN